MQILVTGSNSGFGRLTSLALARKGHTVFATMREPAGKNQAAAADLRGIASAEKLALHVLELDVTDTASVDKAIAAAGALDVVVNNAGYAVNGLAETATPEQYLRELDTNVVGPHRVNRAVLPGMRERHAGLIIQVSSGLGRILLPFLGIYAVPWAFGAAAPNRSTEKPPAGLRRRERASGRGWRSRLQRERRLRGRGRCSRCSGAATPSRPCRAPPRRSRRRRRSTWPAGTSGAAIPAVDRTRCPARAPAWRRIHRVGGGRSSKWGVLPMYKGGRQRTIHITERVTCRMGRWRDVRQRRIS